MEEENKRDYIGFQYKFDNEHRFDFTEMKNFTLFENDYFSDIEFIKSEEKDVNNKILVYFKDDYKAIKDNLAIYRDYAKNILAIFFTETMLTVKSLYLHNLILYNDAYCINSQSIIDASADFNFGCEMVVFNAERSKNNIQNKISNIKFEYNKENPELINKYFEVLLIENVVVRYFIMYSWLYEQCGKNQKETDEYIKNTDIFKENNGINNLWIKKRRKKGRKKPLKETIFTYLRNEIVHNIGESISSKGNEFDKEIDKYIVYLSKILLQKLYEQ